MASCRHAAAACSAMHSAELAAGKAAEHQGTQLCNAVRGRHKTMVCQSQQEAGHASTKQQHGLCFAAWQQ